MLKKFPVEKYIKVFSGILKMEKNKNNQVRVLCNK